MNPLARATLLLLLLTPFAGLAQDKRGAKGAAEAQSRYQANLQSLEETQRLLLGPAAIGDPAEAPTPSVVPAGVRPTNEGGPTTPVPSLTIDGDATRTVERKPMGALKAPPAAPAKDLPLPAAETAPTIVIIKQEDATPVAAPRRTIAPALPASTSAVPTAPSSTALLPQPTPAGVAALPKPQQQPIPVVAVRSARARQGFFFKTCAQAWLAGQAPLQRGDDGYRPALDEDGDGHACETMPLRD